MEMAHPVAVVTALLGALLATACVQRRVEAQDARQRFNDEAPRAWREYSEIATKLRGTVLSEVKDFREGGKLLHRGGGEFKVWGTSAIMIDDSFDPNGSIEANGCNQSYVFSIQRAGKSDCWILTNIIWDIGETAGGARRPDLTVKRFTCTGLRTSTGWLPEMVVDSTFSLDEVQTKSISNETLYDVTFRYRQTERDGVLVEEAGHMLLDPSRYWLLRQAEVRISEPRGEAAAMQSIHIEYQDRDGVPLPKRRLLHVDYRDNNEQIDKDLIWEFDMHRLVDASERDFTLSAFGIPEPTRPAAEGSHGGIRVFVLVTLGIVLLVVGVLLRRQGPQAG